jgi:hypothetical protein
MSGVTPSFPHIPLWLSKRQLHFTLLGEEHFEE